MTENIATLPLTAGGLTEEDVHQFMCDGYLLIREALPPTQAEALKDVFWQDAPVTLDDPTLWTKRNEAIERSFHEGPATGMWSVRLIGILDGLLGPGRYHPPDGTGWVLFNLPGFDELPWKPPTTGWHVDGLHFRHHVDSCEQGLVGLFLFTDIAPGGGATMVRPGSHHIASRILQDAVPDGLELWELCRRIEEKIEHLPMLELPGNAGDLLLMHPHLLHNGSANCSQRVRIASNVCVGMREKLNLNRPDPNDYSILERSIVESLAVVGEV